MRRSKSSLWWRDSNQTASGKPGAVHYTIGHELGHFLNEGHIATASDGFYCTKEDMGYPDRSGRYLRQELEANIFAIELLAPERLIRSRLTPPADL